MRVIGRWWNGKQGRLARRDVRLCVSEVWTVELYHGGVEGRRGEREFDSEDAARAFVARCLDDGGDGWREVGVQAPGR